MSDVGNNKTTIEEALLKNIPEVRLWVNLEEIDSAYLYTSNNPGSLELRLYEQCLQELRRRGANVDRYQHHYKSYCGARKCERL